MFDQCLRTLTAWLVAKLIFARFMQTFDSYHFSQPFLRIPEFIIFVQRYVRKGTSFRIRKCISKQRIILLKNHTQSYP